MKHSWRWFGPNDLTRIDDILQTGATGIVSALHHVPDGDLWRPQQIAERQQQIANRSDGTPSGLTWEVVESLPVSEAIKKQKGEWRTHIANYKQSLENLAAAGISTICYNFMPVIDWTRTDLRWKVGHGGTTMRYDAADFAIFDIFLLQRPGADREFAGEIVEAAEERFATIDNARKTSIAAAVMAGLPGAADSLSLDKVRQHLAEYGAISPDRLRANLIDFLSEVTPVASRLGLRLCCHPDDPPFPLMGLPRIMSTEDDYRRIIEAVDDPANGITLCSGALGARSDNDLPGMMRRLGHRVHFLHLRNVLRESDTAGGSFHESEHLDGSVDMVALIGAIVNEEASRRDQGRADHQIPMRPDHGQEILDDIGRGGQPGYPLIGRMKGLAELRGVERALSAAYRSPGAGN
ncbi:mannonate dehydratase [Rhizobium sp. 1399]|jgi:mannonate dehydratase|uniref:mannonate dehydratase n=1 Tax=Rhizobium sp. 1399 TaxID=2817758 RepID=UPI0028664162|nr:mannonate dehydratase [Rhizobium sp. 1399]MDR6665747.1 mannonate dehydratase [Rhizobium sp. 1399]